MDKNKTQNKYLTTGQVAELLGVSKQWVSTLARQGEIESFRLQGKGWHRIPVASLEEYASKYQIPIDWSAINSSA